jgi:hypothetical protein
MRMMNLDTGLLICNFLLEAALIGLLFYRHAWRTVPAFCLLCIWETLSNAGGYATLHFSPRNYSLYYLLDSAVDSVLEFSVLVELAWSVLRPIRASLPRRTPFVIGIVVLLLGGLIWPFSGLQSFASLAPLLREIAHLQQTTAVLRVLFFVALAGCSQLLSIGWRDRELQVATGLGLVSLVSLGLAMITTHQSTWTQYRHLNQILIGSYTCSLVYWAYCFAHKEAERREFTPQMQNLLLTVAGVARAERAALSASRQSKG